MSARTIVGVCALVVLLGITVYLLVQIPAIFAIGGLVALIAIFLIVGHDAPDAL